MSISEIFCERETVVTYGIFDSLTDTCKHYRSIKKEKITLAEKVKNNPEISKLIGGGIFWIWGDNYDAVMYSEKNTDVSPTIGEKIFRVTDELYNSGIRKAMFGFLIEKDSYLSEKLKLPLEIASSKEEISSLTLFSDSVSLSISF